MFSGFDLLPKPPCRILLTPIDVVAFKGDVLMVWVEQITMAASGCVQVLTHGQIAQARKDSEWMNEG